MCRWSWSWGEDSGGVGRAVMEHGGSGKGGPPPLWVSVQVGSGEQVGEDSGVWRLGGVVKGS